MESKDMSIAIIFHGKTKVTKWALIGLFSGVNPNVAFCMGHSFFRCVAKRTRETIWTKFDGFLLEQKNDNKKSALKVYDLVLEDHDHDEECICITIELSCTKTIIKMHLLQL